MQTYDALPALLSRLLEATRIAASEKALAFGAVGTRVDRSSSVGDTTGRKLQKARNSQQCWCQMGQGGGTCLVRVRHLAVARLTATERPAFLEKVRTGRRMNRTVDPSAALSKAKNKLRLV